MAHEAFAGKQFDYSVMLRDKHGNALYHHTNDGLDSPQVARTTGGRETMALVRTTHAYHLTDEDNVVFKKVPVAQVEVSAPGRREIYRNGEYVQTEDLRKRP